MGKPSKETGAESLSGDEQRPRGGSVTINDIPTTVEPGNASEQQVKSRLVLDVVRNHKLATTAAVVTVVAGLTNLAVACTTDGDCVRDMRAMGMNANNAVLGAAYASIVAGFTLVNTAAAEAASRVAAKMQAWWKLVRPEVSQNPAPSTEATPLNTGVQPA